MNFDECIERRNTHCVKYSQAKTAQRPEDALVMTLADMDLPCCPAIQQAIVERAAHPFYGYQQFDEVLPERVCAWAKARSMADPDYTERQYRDRAVPAGADAAGRWNSDPESVLQPVSQGGRVESAALRDQRADSEGGSL